MGEPVMKESELTAIGEYVKAHIHQWIKEDGSFSEGSRVGVPIEDRIVYLSERVVRVEEGIKNNYELLKQTLDFMNKRFEQVDKRFELLETQMDKRFEQVDKRFTELRTDMNQRFNRMFAFTLAIGALIMGLMSIFEFVT